jgi:hypothetical protein
VATEVYFIPGIDAEIPTRVVRRSAKRIVRDALSAEGLEMVESVCVTIHGNIQLSRMAEGNTKLPKWVLCWSMSPGKACLNCKDCINTCYAMKAYLQYADCENCWDINHDLARNNLAYLEALLVAQISNALSRMPNLIVRIHVSGDFISQEYVDMWLRIAKGFPAVPFYTYTKVGKMFDFSGCPENLNIISSFVDGKLNYGDQEYCDELVSRHGAYLCPAYDGSDVQCMEDCTYCLKGKRPVFLEH